MSTTMLCSGARSGATQSGGSRHGGADFLELGIRCRSSGWRQARRARRRHQDHRPCDLRRRLAFRRSVRDHQADQVHRRPRGPARLLEREHIVGLVVGLPLSMDGSDSPRTQSVRAFARNLAPLDLPIAAVGRALVDPGGRARDDRSRRQPRAPRREGRRARRRPHPPGRDRRAGQSFRRRNKPLPSWTFFPSIR